MGAPIPLSAPDGNVYAWACSVCRSVYGIVRGFPPPETTARGCCTGCPACLKWSSGGLCPSCTADGRRAFEVLAAIGMAVAVREYGRLESRLATQHPASVLAWSAVRDRVLADLCGVDVEAVRGWW